MMASQHVECDYEMLVKGEETPEKEVVGKREVLVNLKQAETAKWRYTTFPALVFCAYGAIIGCATAALLLTATGVDVVFEFKHGSLFNFFLVVLIPCAVVTLVMNIVKSWRLLSQWKPLHIDYQFQNKDEYENAMALCEPFRILCSSEDIKSLGERSKDSVLLPAAATLLGRTAKKKDSLMLNLAASAVIGAAESAAEKKTVEGLRGGRFDDCEAETSNFEKRQFCLFSGVSACRKNTESGDSERQDVLCPNVQIVSLKVAGMPKLYFLPDAVYAYYEEANGQNRWVDLSYKDVKFGEVGLFEFVYSQDDSIPSDTAVVGSAWKYATKTGDRDMRFSDNVEYPKCAYGAFELEVHLPEQTVSKTIVFSKTDAIESMADAVSNYENLVG